MLTKAELFKEATEKNRLRKEAGLPLLNIRDEIEQLAYRDRLERYRLGLALFAIERNVILERARSEVEFENGPIQGFAMHLLVQDRYLPRIRAFLASKGYPWPGLRTAVRYGVNRPMRGDEDVEARPDEKAAAVEAWEADLKAKLDLIT